jgi:hypothetical protein
MLKGASIHLSESGLTDIEKNEVVSDKERVADEVERLYSTKPIQVVLRERRFRVPVNFFTERGRDRPDTWAPPDGFSFVLFLPDFSGFTKDNWKAGGFDKRRIDVLEVSEGNTHRKAETIFSKLRLSLEPEPFAKSYELSGYRWKNRDNRGSYWVGKRATGELFLLQSTDVPGEPPLFADSYPLCMAQYYRDSEKLFIAYQYSLDNFQRWHEIDEAVWGKLRSWRMK